MGYSQPATSSGAIAVTAGTSVIPAATTAGQVKSGILTAVQCVAGSAAGSVMIYDGNSTSGLLLVSLTGVPSGTTQFANIANGVAFANGLFIVVSGTGAQAVVHYQYD